VLLRGALIAAGIAVSQQHTAQQQLRVATVRLPITRADSLASSDPLTAMKLSLAAHRIDPSCRCHPTLPTGKVSTVRSVPHQRQPQEPGNGRHVVPNEPVTAIEQVHRSTVGPVL
jgi:hypothetical protein